VNASKAKGTRGETAVVNYLRVNGFPTAERRALAGAADRGDILATIGVIIEVKAGAAAQTASPAKIDTWLEQTRTEQANAGADIGVLVVQRRGIGTSRPGQWLAYLPGEKIATELLTGVTVCLTLADTVTVLRRAGHGDTP